MAELTIAEVTTSAGLEALAPAWQELWGRAPAATPFQSPAWLIPWWQEIGGGVLRVLTAQTDGQLVAVLPLYLQHGRELGKLLPLGIAVSDYLDGLFQEGCGLAAAEAMLRHLAGRDDWRCCELHPLRADSPLLEARAPSGCSDEVLAFEPCLALAVPAGARQLDDVLPRKMRANLRYFEAAPSAPGASSSRRPRPRRFESVSRR